MHYGSTAFSVNGQNTIKVINDPTGSKTSNLGGRLENGAGMSVLDAQQVNALYQCTHGKGRHPYPLCHAYRQMDGKAFYPPTQSSYRPLTET